MRTKHIQKRMSQRAIRGELVQLAIEFGVPLHDGKRRLDRKAIMEVLRSIDLRKKTLLDAYRKGGVIVVVGDDDALITTYRVS